LHVHVRPQVLAREEVEPVPAYPKDRGAHAKVIGSSPDKLMGMRIDWRSCPWPSQNSEPAVHRDPCLCEGIGPTSVVLESARGLLCRKVDGGSNAQDVYGRCSPFRSWLGRTGV
jgi:hypothetical protein